MTETPACFAIFLSQTEYGWVDVSLQWHVSSALRTS